MPAMILVLRIGKVTVPLPWFLVWLLAAPLALLAWMAGSVGLLFLPRSYSMRVACQAWRVVLLAMRLHGIRVHVDTEDQEVLVQFI